MNSMRLILIMGLLSFLFGGKSQAADFEIAPLTQEQAEFVEFKSKKPKSLFLNTLAKKNIMTPMMLIK